MTHELFWKFCWKLFGGIFYQIWEKYFSMTFSTLNRSIKFGILINVYIFKTKRHALQCNQQLNTAGK